MAGLLSIFGLDNPRLNPEFDPSKPGNIPQLQINERGEVEGVTIPQNVQRYKSPGLIRQLAGDPSAKLNANYANEMQALAFGMYDKAKLAELENKQRLIALAKAAEETRKTAETESGLRTKEELERQRAMYAFAHGFDPSAFNDQVVSSNLLKTGQLTTGNTATEAEIAGLKSKANKQLYSDPNFAGQISRIAAIQPYNLQANAFNPVDMVDYRVGGIFPTVTESITIGPNGLPIQNKTTSGAPFYGGTYVNGAEIKLGAPRTGAFSNNPPAKKAILDTGVVDTNAAQATPSTFVVPSKLKPKPSVSPTIPTGSTVPQQSQLPLGEIDPFGIMQSYKNTFNRQWLPSDPDRLNTLLLDQTLQRLQSR